MLSNIIYTLFLSTSALAATAEEWSSRTIYQLITDRFASTGDGAISCDTSQRKYCGGTWKGITKHLDYIQNMGFDAVWISPVSANLEGNTSLGEAFHGYWTRDFTALNPHFGTDQDLRELAGALHARGMYLMVDVVINHVAAPSLPGKNGFSLDGFYHPFTDASFFHQQCFVRDSQDQGVVEQCWLGDESLPLPDLNTEDPRVVQELSDWIHNLVQQYGIDGLRLDTVKHVRKDFWPNWAQAAGIFTMGEVLAGDTDYAAPYTETLDAILDYPSYFPLFQVFTNSQSRFSTIVTVLQRAQATYRNGLFGTGSFIENHDQPRLASVTTDRALVTNAMTFSFVHDGIPITYYGSEQNYQGGADPSNREALWLSAYQEDKPLVHLLKTLNAARRQAIASTPAFLTTPMQFYAVEDHSVAIFKPPMLALLTNLGSDTTSSAHWQVPPLFAPHTALVDVLTCTPSFALADGGVGAVSQYGMPQVLMPVSALRGGKVCDSAMSTEALRISGGVARRTNGGAALMAAFVVPALAALVM